MVTEKIMVCLATQVMMGIISTGITEGKGRAGVMIPIPGYSMYQARLLQHNTHQVIPIRSRILLYLVHVADGFVWEGQRKGVRREWSALSHTPRACCRGFTSLFTLACK